MSKRFLITLLLIIGIVASNAVAQINPATVTTGHVYLFDNVSGGQVPDDSANNNTGTIVGDPQVVDGLSGKALQFDGVDDGVNIPDSQFINITNGPWSNRTVVAVFNCANVAKQEKQTVFEEGGRTRGLTIYVFAGEVYVGGWNRSEYNWNPGSWISTPINSNEWHSVAMVIRNGGEAQEDNKFEMWMDGNLIGRAPGGQIYNHSNDNAIGYTLQNNVFHDDTGSGNGWYFEGIIDELWILNDALTQAELGAIGPRPTKAKNPVPANEATDVPREVVLGWETGMFAPAVSGHTVYFSENFNDVNDGVGGTAQDANSYAPQRLDFGTTYYWRVDEVNGPPDYTVYQGDVWSFTTEPVGYAIENITATASSAQQADMGPENTVNGSGLDDNDLHSIEPTDMWLSSTEALGAWIEYEFDKVYKLHEMWVWNSNQRVESLVGFGLKDVTIEYSTNGTDYTTLGTTHEFARAPGTEGYAHNTTVDFEGVAAKYVRLTANSNWAGIIPQYSLSEVRFLYIPVRAREPNPDSGATDVDVDVTLSFRAGREAATHNVYISTDEQAVIDGTAPVTTLTETSYGPVSVDLAQTYYWRVDEVNEAETPATWEGDVWNFATHEFLAVDDFESYNDLDTGDPESNRIYLAWIDGWDVPVNGSQVGYTEPPFCEQTIVHGGAQSMPFFYNNTAGATYSEAELTLSPPQDWTKYGIKTLSLRFFGEPNNTPGQMYVKVNDSKVSYDGDAGGLRAAAWQPWNIDLASVGTNVQNVTKLVIGIDGNGATGKLLFDDIRLYPYERQFVTPVEPNAAGLVGHWQLDGNFDDSSGNNRHGTAVGEPTFVLGKINQAISLDGVDDYVTITGYKGIAADRTDPNNPVQRPFSVACWINTADAAGRGGLVNWGSSDGAPVGGQYQNFSIHEGRLRAEHGDGRFRGAALVSDGQWHHVAMVVAEGANIEPPMTQLYVDGQKDTLGADTVNAQNIWNITEEADVAIGVRASHVDRFFNGMIDDARIYDRALTQEEIAWLAGRTQPFDKPF